MDKKEIDWKSRYETLAKATRSLQKENDEFRRHAEIQKLEKKQWLEDKVSNLKIIEMRLSNSDNVIRQLQDEIIRLKKVLRRNNIKVD